MTCKEIIKCFIEELLKNNSIVYTPSYVFETTIIEFGKSKFSKLYTPSTYSRAFREIREKNLFKEYSINESFVKNIKYFTIKRSDNVL